MGNGDELMDNSWNLDREGVAGFGWDGIGNDRGLGAGWTVAQPHPVVGVSLHTRV